MTAHELFIIEEQCAGYMFLEDLQEIACAMDKSENLARAAIFTYGVIQGKRIERKKRKMHRD